MKMEMESSGCCATPADLRSSDDNKSYAKRFLDNVSLNQYSAKKKKRDIYLLTLPPIEDNSDIKTFFDTLINELKYAQDMMSNHEFLMKFFTNTRLWNIFDTLFENLGDVNKFKYSLCHHQTNCKHEKLCGFIHLSDIKELRLIYNNLKESFKIFFESNCKRDADVLINNLFTLSSTAQMFMCRRRYGLSYSTYHNK